MVNGDEKILRHRIGF